MSNEEFDPFGLSTGLLSDFTLTIESAGFNTDAGINDGNTLCLNIQGRTDDDDQPEWDALYSTGKSSGWESVDGVTAQRADGKRKGFNNSSGYGLFISAALEAGAGDELRKRDAVNGPFNARIWDGLKFHMKAKEIDYGGEIGKKNKVLPVAFLGVEGGGGTTTPAANPVAMADVAPLSAGLRVKLKKLAKDCADHETFIDRAFSEVDGVDGNEAAETAVLEPTGIWAEVAA